MIYLFLSITLGFILALVVKMKRELELIIRWLLIIISILSEVIYFVVKVNISNVNLFLSLPIYWCAVANIIQIIALIKKDSEWIRFAFFMTIGPFISLIVKLDNVEYTLRYFLSHALIITSSIYAIIIYYKVPKDIFTCKVRAFNFIMIYFLFFEMLYPIILSTFINEFSTFIDYLYIFDNMMLNVGFVIIVGSMFAFIYSYFVLDFLIFLIIKVSKRIRIF